MYGNPFEEEAAPPPRPPPPSKDDDRTPLMASRPTSSGPSYLARKSTSYQGSAASVPPPVPARDDAAKADMLARRAKELDERERQLNLREKNAKELEENAQKQEDPRAPNWPPCLPKKFVYQDFEVDIPQEVRARVKMTYYHMFAVAVMVLYNMLCGIVVLIVAAALGDFIVACVLVVIVVALVFFTYRRLYKASRVGSSLAYGIFLAGMIIEIIIDIVGALGWSGTGFYGIKWCCDLFRDGNKGTGIMCVINAILWILSALFDIFLFFDVRHNFNKAGGMKALKQQAASRATTGVINFVKEHPDEAKKAGKAAVNYAKENPDVIKSAASTAASAAREGAAVL